jgi:serine/threonine protein phosphatase PrpC
MTTGENLTVHYAAFTHSGKRYRQNQDALLVAGVVQQKAGFWQGQFSLDRPLRFAVADGAGGLPSAAKASRCLLQELAALDQTQPNLSPRHRLIPLHHRLVKICQSQRALQNAGATLITAEIAADGGICLWHAGDSRGYHYGLQGLHRLTDDHTLAFCLSRSNGHSGTDLRELSDIQMGQALDNLFVFSPDAEEPFIGLQRLRLMSGEKLLLITDGVTLYLSDDTLTACLKGNDLVANVRQIFDEVMATDAEDNVSAVAITIN